MGVTSRFRPSCRGPRAALFSLLRQHGRAKLCACVRVRPSLLLPFFVFFACRLPNSGPPGTKTAGDRTPFPLHGVLVIVSYSACATSSYFRANAQSRCGFLCVCVFAAHITVES